MASDHDEQRPDGDEHPGRLRSALIEDGQPSFEWWLPLPGVAIALLWALYNGVTGDGVSEFATQLLWPGVAIFAGATIAAYLGWRLDLD